MDENSKLKNDNLSLTKIYEESVNQTHILEKQATLIKRQTMTIFVLMFAVTITLLILSVQIGGILEEADSAISEITVLTEELNSVLEESNLTELLNNANLLIEDSGKALTKALEDVDAALNTVGQIDIDSLNSAIADLQRIVQPLANLFAK